MLGIPVSIVRDGKDETIYLSTRRSGPAGQAMRDAKRRYNDACLQIAKGTTKLSLLMVRVKQIPDDADPASPEELRRAGRLAEDLQALCADADKISDELQSARQAVQDAAEDLIGLAIRDNHGPETEAILDCLSDAQIQTLVKVIESGEPPEDFFIYRATPPSASTILPSAGAPGAPSSKPALPDLTSRKAG